MSVLEGLRTIREMPALRPCSSLIGETVAMASMAVAFAALKVMRNVFNSEFCSTCEKFRCCVAGANLPINLPIASFAGHPIRFSAAAFQLVIFPSVEMLMMASREFSTI